MDWHKNKGSKGWGSTAVKPGGSPAELCSMAFTIELIWVYSENAVCKLLAKLICYNVIYEKRERRADPDFTQRVRPSSSRRKGRQDAEETKLNGKPP